MGLCAPTRKSYYTRQEELRKEQEARNNLAPLRAAVERFVAAPNKFSLADLIEGSLGVDAARDYVKHMVRTATSSSWFTLTCRDNLYLNCRLLVTKPLEAKQGEKPKPPTLDIEAYNGGPMRLAGWRLPVVVDIDGVDGLGRPIPILRDHDVSRPVGHGTAFAKLFSLQVAGVLSFDNADAKEIASSSSKGFPWQASIGLMPSRVQELDEGEWDFANGERRFGPVVIVREGTLREVSILPLGADSSTKTSVAASIDETPRHKRELGRKAKV